MPFSASLQTKIRLLVTLEIHRWESNPLHIIHKCLISTDVRAAAQPRIGCYNLAVCLFDIAQSWVQLTGIQFPDHELPKVLLSVPVLVITQGMYVLFKDRGVPV